MRNQRSWMLLAILAACGLGASLLLPVLPVEGQDWIAFPFSQMGAGLRQLSLSGQGGNIAAWSIYLILGLLPVGLLVWRIWKRRAGAEDALLPLISLFLLWGLYLMINPGGMARVLGKAAMAGKMLFGACIWSAVCCYAVLRLRAAAEKDRPQRWLRRLVYAVMAVSALHLGASVLGDFFKAVSLQNLFPVATLCVKSIPAVLGLKTAMAALELLTALEQGRYSREAVTAAKTLSHWCARSLTATALAELAYHLLQLLLAPALAHVNISVNLPLSSLVFFCAVLLLAQLIARGSQLQDDNDLFI